MKLISLEGAAGAGKSTAAKLIKVYFERIGLRVIIEKPIKRKEFVSITTDFGEPQVNIWTMTLPKMDYKVGLFCFWAILIRESQRWATEKYDVVIVDRYIETVSGLCYAMVSKECQPHIDEYYCFVSNFLYPHVRIPNITFLFDIDLKIASERTEKREERAYTLDDINIFTSISELNKYVAEREKDRFISIDSSVDIDKVFEQVLPYINL